jgi:hypothetical protein
LTLGAMPLRGIAPYGQCTVSASDIMVTAQLTVN